MKKKLAKSNERKNRLLIGLLCLLFSNTQAQQTTFQREMFYTDSTALLFENNYIKNSDASVKWQPFNVAMPFKPFKYYVYGPTFRVSIYTMTELVKNGGYGHTGAYRDTLPNDAHYFDMKSLEFLIEKNGTIETKWTPVLKAKSYIEEYRHDKTKTYDRKGHLLYFSEALSNADSVTISLRKKNRNPFVTFLFKKRSHLESPPVLIWRKDSHTDKTSIENFFQDVSLKYYRTGNEPFYEYWPGYSDNGNDKVFEDSKLGFVFRSRKDIPNDSAFEYRLLVSGKAPLWKKSDNIIFVYNLKAGNQYRLEVRYRDKPQYVYQYRFYVPANWYQSIWLKIAVVFVFSLLGLILFYFLRSRQRKRQQAEQINKMKMLSAQLNPHFIFNALGSIQGLLNKGEIEAANHYLSGFGKLLRNTLTSTDKNTISLQEEMYNIENYIKLEQLRKPFVYAVKVQDEITLSEIEMLPLLFQPIIENAIKHASNNTKPLAIDIKISKGNYDLEILITDNGKGFDITASQNGQGLKLIKARIDLYNQTTKKKKIIQKMNSDCSGTVFSLKFVSWLNDD